MTTSQPWPDGGRPAHDPVAEDMDLLTHQEAAARFFDEIEQLRATETGLVTANGTVHAAGLVRVQARIRELESAIERILSRRTPSY